MAPLNSQANRIGRLYTPLPENTLSLMGFSGTEAVNEINLFKVKAVSSDGPVDMNALLGQPMRIELDSVYGTTHHIHQAVFSAQFLGKHDRGYTYEFELRPWIWLLSRQSHSRIFDHRTVLEIINEVMADYSGMFQCPVNFKSSASFPILEYTVQYGETDLNFILRLMEQFNISYLVEMTAAGQTLALMTDGTEFTKADGPKTRTFSKNRSENQRDAEVFDHWTDNRTITTTNIRTDDYNFKTPAVAMDVVSSMPVDYSPSSMEYFEYPGRYTSEQEGLSVAGNILTSANQQASVIRATGDMRSLAAGVYFKMVDHTEEQYNHQFAVTGIQHMFTGNQFQSGGTGQTAYHGIYRLLKSGTPFGPERKTPRPVMRGPQTAMVVDGADGSIDEYGRIVVRFHWNKTAVSMPCRVAQMWASKEWGTIFTPHSGMEVIVEFLDGDPDRPVVTGCVYNDDNMPPWPLPSKKLVSGILTVRDNWLLFDDTEGSELIDIHAKKDYTTLIDNDYTLEVMRDAKTHIHRDDTHIVDGNRDCKVAKDETTLVKGTLTLESETKIIIKVGGSVITLEPSGIKIEATKISVAAVAELKTTGAMAEHTATGIMTIKGAMVLIN